MTKRKVHKDTSITIGMYGKTNRHEKVWMKQLTKKKKSK